MIFNIFQLFFDGSRIVLMDDRVVRNLSGSFLTACASTLSDVEKDGIAQSLGDGLVFLQSNA